MKRTAGLKNAKRDGGQDRTLGRGTTTEGEITQQIALAMYAARQAGDRAEFNRTVGLLIGRMEHVVGGLIGMFAPPSPSHYWDRDDLRSHGRIGVLTAAKTYEPTKGAFTTYATYAIRTAMRNLYRDHPPGPIRVPHYITNAMHRKAEGKPVHQEPQPAYLEAALAVMGHAYDIHDADHSADPADPRPGPADEVEAAEGTMLPERKRFRKALARLTPRDRELVCRLYGLGRESSTLTEMAVERGVTREAIRLRVDKALRRIHEMLGLPAAGSTEINRRIHAA